MGLLTVDEFINASGGPSLSDAQTAQTQYYIDTVSGYLEDRTGTTFHLVIDDEVKMKTDGNGTIVIQFDPINDVTQIVDWKTQVVEPDWCWDGFDQLTGLCAFRTYLVTVSYGMVATPSIKGVCIEAVKRGLASNPTGLKMKTVGDVSYQYGDMLAFSEDDKLVISNYTDLDMTTWSLATDRDHKGFNRRWPWASGVLNGPMGEFDD